MPDLLKTLNNLPKGLCGVVFRHDHVPDRARLAKQVARLCRQRRLALVIAGDRGLAFTLRAGRHLRGGHGPAPHSLATASAHTPAERVRARRNGVTLAFVSPVFPTESHKGAPALGVHRFAAIARHAPGRAAALGGITGQLVRRLPRRSCQAIGAIAALVA